MKILAIHNLHRAGSASGDDQVFKVETAATVCKMMSLTMRGC